MEETLVKFDYFYGGHVEMPDAGFSATPVGERNLSEELLASSFSEAKAMAKIMDPLGYDTLWMSEHHFQSEGFGGIPNVHMTSVYLAEATQNMNFGAFFNIVPAWHPLRLAEDFASADVMTGGRVRFGIGRGYILREVETLGSPLEDDEANRDLFEEQVEIIIKAWGKDSFSHRGKNYVIPADGMHRGKKLQEITLVPRPIHKPVDFWQPIASGSQRGMDFMVKHGIKGVIAGGTAPGGSAEKTALRWKETLAKAGQEVEVGERLALGVQIHMADSEEKAIEEATPYFEEQLKVLAPLGMIKNLSEYQIEATADPGIAPLAGLPTLQDGVEDGTWICGPPRKIKEEIAGILKRFPKIERLSVGLGGLAIPPSVIRKDLEWFGKEVLPEFREKD